jgi:hypothetical protein
MNSTEQNNIAIPSDAQPLAASQQTEFWNFASGGYTGGDWGVNAIFDRSRFLFAHRADIR